MSLSSIDKLKALIRKDSIDGKSGHKPKKVDYHTDPPMNKNRYKEIKMTPSKFLRYAGGDAGNRVTHHSLEDAHSYPEHESIPHKKYDVKVNPLDRKPMTTDTNYNVRGDELGGVEYYQRQIRQGDPIGKPNFSLDASRKQVGGHDGRHRAVALQREGEKKIPVDISGWNPSRANELGVGVENNERKNMKGIKRQHKATSTDKKDTRHPIFGRKKAIDRLKALISKKLNKRKMKYPKIGEKVWDSNQRKWVIEDKQGKSTNTLEYKKAIDKLKALINKREYWDNRDKERANLGGKKFDWKKHDVQGKRQQIDELLSTSHNDPLKRVTPSPLLDDQTARIEHDFDLIGRGMISEEEAERSKALDKLKALIRKEGETPSKSDMMGVALRRALGGKYKNPSSKSDMMGEALRRAFTSKALIRKDSMDGKSGHKPKKVEYDEAIWVNPRTSKDIKMKPSKFLEYAAGESGRKIQSTESISDAHTNPEHESTPFPKRDVEAKRDNKKPMETDTNYNVRGDELGGVEAYQRQIRQGDKILKPYLTIRSDKDRIGGHEGRHRVLALQREGEKKIPVNINADDAARARELGIGAKPDSKRDDIYTKYRYRKDLKDIQRQNPEDKLSEEDTRHPMLGRKKAIDRLKALIRKEGETNSGEAGHKKDTRKPEGDTSDNLLTNEIKLEKALTVMMKGRRANFVFDQHGKVISGGKGTGKKQLQPPINKPVNTGSSGTHSLERVASAGSKPNPKLERPVGMDTPKFGRVWRDGEDLVTLVPHKIKRKKPKPQSPTDKLKNPSKPKNTGFNYPKLQAKEYKGDIEKSLTIIFKAYTYK